LEENLKAFPACDLLYIPLLKQREAQAFKDYIMRAGQDSLVLLYLLREHEAYARELEAARLTPMDILKRLMWINKSGPKAGACPAGYRPSRVVFDGYTDEITEECYTVVLAYHSGDSARSESLAWCGPLEKDQGEEDAASLMKQYKIPLLHRHIIQEKKEMARKPPKGSSTEQEKKQE
jgi:hypothetical protein